VSEISSAEIEIDVGNPNKKLPESGTYLGKRPIMPCVISIFWSGQVV